MLMLTFMIYMGINSNTLATLLQTKSATLRMSLVLQCKVEDKRKREQPQISFVDNVSCGTVSMYEAIFGTVEDQEK